MKAMVVGAIQGTVVALVLLAGLWLAVKRLGVVAPEGTWDLLGLAAGGLGCLLGMHRTLSREDGR